MTAPSASARATSSASGCAVASRRWSTGSRRSRRRAESSWPGRDRASARPTTSVHGASRRDPDRLHGRDPSRRLDAPARAVRRRGVRQDRTRRPRRDAAVARRACAARPGPSDDMDIAIIGSGVSGLTAACALRSEHGSPSSKRDATPGGHVGDRRRSTRRSARSPSTPGFIVYNEPTYPRFVGPARRARRGDPAQRHVARLGVPRVRRSRSARAARRALRRSRALACEPGPLADARATSSASTATRGATLDAASPSRLTLASSSTSAASAAAFRDHFLVPITSAVWSTAPDGSCEFPVDYLLRFLDNHGLIGDRQRAPVADRPRRLRDLRRAHRAGAAGRALRTGVARRRRSARDATGVTVSARPTASASASTPWSWPRTPTTRSRLLADADPRERARPGRLRVLDERVVLHTDERVLPAPPRRLGVVERRHSRLPSAGRRAHDDLPHEPAAVAARAGRVLRVGQPGRPDPTRARHPRARRSATRCTRSGRSRPRPRSRALQGHRRTWYAGAHLGYGFHEDGCRSGFEAAELIQRRAVAERAA